MGVVAHDGLCGLIGKGICALAYVAEGMMDGTFLHIGMESGALD